MILELSVIGIICSCLYILLFNVYPGGIIVPVYFAMYLFQPNRLIGTVLISILSLLIFKLLAKRLLIFGRRRFVFLLIVASFLSLCVNFIFKEYAIDFVGYQAIGIFVPGLLANNMSKQGGTVTLLSLFTVSTLVFFTFRLVYII